MRNRIPRKYEQTDDKQFRKKDRGSSEVITLSDGDLALTKWLANKPVLISTCLSDQSSDTCKRWNKSTKTYQYVRRAEVVKQYNVHISGGISRVDS